MASTMNGTAVKRARRMRSTRQVLTAAIERMLRCEEKPISMSAHKRRNGRLGRTVLHLQQVLVEADVTILVEVAAVAAVGGVLAGETRSGLLLMQMELVLLSENGQFEMTNFVAQTSDLISVLGR